MANLRCMQLFFAPSANPWKCVLSPRGFLSQNCPLQYHRLFNTTSRATRLKLLLSDNLEAMVASIVEHSDNVKSEECASPINDDEGFTNNSRSASSRSELTACSEDRRDRKRKEYLSWEEYFMAVACLAAQRSKDPVTQVGAVIVNPDLKIIGSGYNGMPNGCSDDVMPWGKDSDDPLKTKYPFVCHAEMNAILNRNCESVKGSTIYTVLFPCNECAKLIIQAGISEVVYKRDKPGKVEVIASKKMFDIAGVRYRQFHSKRKVLVDFGCQLHDAKLEMPDETEQSSDSTISN